jgi:chromosome segregation ATPase
MATEMELSQVSQMLSWLDAERKKDRAMMATLDERIQGVTGLVEQQARRIQELDTVLTAMRAQLATMTQVDRVLEEFKTDIQSIIERRDAERKKSEREAARLRAIEIQDLSRAIGEIKKELPRITKVEDEVPTRRAEEKRLGDTLKQVALQVDVAMKQLEERTRGIPYLEEGRRQDNKRILQLEGDRVESSKRVDAVAARQSVLEDALSKLPPKFDPLYERLNAQDKSIEEIRVAEFRHQQAMKAWDEEIVKFRAQMTDYGDVLARLREQAQINQKAAADLAAFQETLRQRVSEISEVERLFEERVKRTLEEEQAEHEKRWQKYSMRAEERWQDHARPHEELLDRIEEVEIAQQPVTGEIDQIRKQHEELVQHLVDFGMGLAETRRSTLPNVSVPPATSPEDGRGIPDYKPLKRQ